MSPPDMPTKRQTHRSRTNTTEQQDGPRQDGHRDARLRPPERHSERRLDPQPDGARRGEIPPRRGAGQSSYLLTQQQIRCMEQLPEGHKLVSTRSGAPIVRRPDGRLLRVQPNGRFVTTISVERVQSYLRLNESMR